MVGSIQPTGNVSFYWFKDTCPGEGVAGGTAIGIVYSPFAADTPSTVIAHPSGNLTPLTGGDYFFKAVYAGDGNYDPGESACEPFHVLSGNIIVKKVTDPPSSLDSFTFDPSWSGTNFNLKHGEQNGPTELAPGSSYSVFELTPPQGWSFDHVTCTLQGGGATGTASGSGITNITVEAGNTTTCTFYNTAGYLGYTPGFWKNHTKFTKNGHDAWAFTTLGSNGVNLHVVDIFPCAPSPFNTHTSSNTLLKALSYKGGSGIDGARQILLRAAVAAYLNASLSEYLGACNPYGQFPLTMGNVTDLVCPLLAGTDRAAMLQVAYDLDQMNNLGQDDYFAWNGCWDGCCVLPKP
jgi:hypothetical protein